MTNIDKHGKSVNATPGIQGFHEKKKTESNVTSLADVTNFYVAAEKAREEAIRTDKLVPIIEPKENSYTELDSSQHTFGDAQVGVETSVRRVWATPYEGRLKFVEVQVNFGTVLHHDDLGEVTPQEARYIVHGNADDPESLTEEEDRRNRVTCETMIREEWHGSDTPNLNDGEFSRQLFVEEGLAGWYPTPTLEESDAAVRDAGSTYHWDDYDYERQIQDKLEKG